MEAVPEKFSFDARKLLASVVAAAVGTGRGTYVKIKNKIEQN